MLTCRIFQFLFFIYLVCYVNFERMKTCFTLYMDMGIYGYIWIVEDKSKERKKNLKCILLEKNPVCIDFYKGIIVKK